MTTSRRSFLKQALMSGLAASSHGIPKAIARARAIAPAPNTTWEDAEHVVILMQENRSFDHVFGSLAGVRGFNDPHPLRLSSGHPSFFQPDKQGNYCPPWRLNIHDTKVTWMGSIPHSRDSQVDAWNGGRYDNWLDAKRPHNKEWHNIPLTMGHYTREDLPFYYAMADAFTVCDQNYCGAMTSTSPNRLLFWTGTVRDKQSTYSNVYMRNPEILDHAQLEWTTFPERLEKAGISWGFYQNELGTAADMNDEEEAWLSNFACNILEYFKAYNVSSRSDFSDWIDERINECEHHIRRLEKQEDLATGGIAPKLVEARILHERLTRRRDSAQPYEQLSAEEQSLFKRAFITNKADPHYRELETITFANDTDIKEMKAPRGDILHQFRKDVQQGKLPTVSWLAAPEHFSDHPTSAWFGTWYVSEILNILTANPDIWKKTIFIMTYDENDGYFDHCPSFAAPDPDRPETGCSSAKIGPDGLEYTNAQDEIAQGVPEHLARSAPIGLGFRVPMIIASPWSRGGWVNSELCDHSSSLRFLERFVEAKFGKTIREDNISPWRRAICGDLTSCFHPAAETAPPLTYINRNQHLRSIEDARNRPLPGGYQFVSSEEIKDTERAGASRLLPQQEPGIRPSCALPYTLHCNGGNLQEGDKMALTLQADNRLFGNHTAGAPFLICSYDQGVMVTSGTYAVAAGDQLPLQLALPQGNGQYDVAVHAPNGFYRLYQGHKSSPSIALDCAYEVISSPSGKSLASTTPSQTKLHITLRNISAQTIRALLHLKGPDAKQYSVTLPSHGQKNISFDLTTRHGWYDITINLKEDRNFHRHLAGRIETGLPSITDPLMAG